ncbi:Hypothetical predicted protein [Pelobates cultripes]|uniref:Uncharacterized protein n=1 Tax=Pelobates cultripes TaxID=61616 RepID=A0AAD1S9S5_PELCU|nr:Hypothetical predicted protein [Pelobates cultripes]
MSKKDVVCFWIVLLLCQELQTDPIAEMGPSSGILIQETPLFILTEKRILTQRVLISLDPKISVQYFIDAASCITNLVPPKSTGPCAKHLGASPETFCIQYYFDEQLPLKVPHRYKCCFSLCQCQCSCRNRNVCSQLYYCPETGYGNLCTKAAH